MPYDPHFEDSRNTLSEIEVDVDIWISLKDNWFDKDVGKKSVTATLTLDTKVSSLVK